MFDDLFLTKESFSAQIEEKVLSGLSYFDAVLEFCEDSDKEPDELLKFMSQVILEKVRKSANDTGLFVTNEIDLESL
jgi:hypothetical protein